MAGIGFELKKLYRKRSVFYRFRAVFYSSFVIIGPQLMILFLLLAFRALLSSLDLSYSAKNLFMVSTAYPLLLSQIITSGFSMTLTRYAADCLYERKPEKILPSLSGALTVCLPLGTVVCAALLWRSPISLPTKFAACLILMMSIVMWLQMVYLSVLRDYRKIALSFLFGTALAVAAGFLLLRRAVPDPVTALLSVFGAGLLLINVLLHFFIRSFLRGEEPENGYFEFFRCLKKYPSLFLVGLFYTLALYAHNFIFWQSGLRILVLDTYPMVNAYDIPCFFAFLTILPTCVLFPVHLETSFYETYQKYYAQIIYGGDYRDIEKTRTAMCTVLWQEIAHTMELQLFCSSLCIVAGNYFLQFFSFTQSMIATFNILTLGAFCSISMYVAVLVDLYFENRKGALASVSIFLAACTGLTVLSLRLGPDFYGTGFFLAAFAALAFCLLNLRNFLNRIDFITFCSQPLFAKGEQKP